MLSNKIALGDKRVAFAAFALMGFGSLMIVSAEMGNSAGDTSYLTTVIIKQAVFVLAGIIAYLTMANLRLQRIGVIPCGIAYLGIAAVLISCRFFGQINGAYAWIPIGSIATIQPSEFAKAFMILFACCMLCHDRKENNVKFFWWYCGCVLFYTLIILGWQHDLGSAVVLFVMSYCMAMIPRYKELRKYQNYMTLLVIGGIGYLVSLFACSAAFLLGMGPVAAACIFVFIVSHALGQGTVIWVLIAEVFPQRFRAQGQALGSFTHWFFAAAVSFVFPMAVEAVPPWAIFGFFGLMMVLHLLWAVFCVPETKGRRLEDINL